MRSPNTGNPMRLVEGEAVTYTLRGEQFQVRGPAWQCPDTGERYLGPEHLDEVFARLHHAWRERHGIAKEDLQRRAQALGLSDAQASALLGFGVNQYRTYKTTDKLPSKSNARLLQLLCDDRALPALLEAAGPALNKTTRRKLLAYAAQHQLGALITAATITTTTIGISTEPNGAGQLAALTAEHLEAAGDYSYAMAA
jgi:hypothetical protein